MFEPMFAYGQMVLLANWMHWVFGPAIFLTSFVLIVLVLLQRGRGGGLAGALGGMGGQSAFGTKAGDVFTRLTTIITIIWILLCITAIKAMTDVNRGARGVPPNNVTDVNELPNEVPVGAKKNAKVGITVKANDPDGDNSKIRFEMTVNVRGAAIGGGASSRKPGADGRFKIAPTSGVITVDDSSKLTEPGEHEIRVQVIDEKKLSYLKRFTIKVVGEEDSDDSTSDDDSDDSEDGDDADAADDSDDSDDADADKNDATDSDEDSDDSSSDGDNAADDSEAKTNSDTKTNPASGDSEKTSGNSESGDDNG